MTVTASARITDSARQKQRPRIAVPGRTMSARLVVRMLDHAEAAGASRHTLLEGARLDGRSLSDPEGRVPVEAVHELLHMAEAATGDMQFGLRVAQALRIEDLDAFGFLLTTSATLGDAIAGAQRYHSIVNDGGRLTAELRGDAVHVAYTPVGPWHPAERHIVELMFYDIAINAGRVLGRALEIRAVRLRHSAPLGPAEHEQIWQSRVELGADTNELIMPQAVLALPMPEANEAMCRYFERQLGEQAARLPASESLSDRVRAALAERLAGGVPPVEGLAGGLGMSARSLQRRLHDEGTSVHALADALRRERALAMLAAFRPVSEIADSLGYSEPSAFHRAFRRWTGTTPEAARRGSR